MIANSEAIILQSRKFGDTSKIVCAFTKEFGKISLLAKGARNPKSKFGGALDQISQCNVTFYRKPNRDLYVLSKAEITASRRRLSESYERLTAALALAESVETSQEAGERNTDIFDLLAEALDALNVAESNEYSIVAAFQIRLAQIMGFAMTTRIRGVCEARPAYHFSFADGAILAANDYRVPSTGWVFSQEEYVALDALSNCSLAQAAAIEQTIAQKAKIHDFIAHYFRFHLEKTMRYRTHELLLE